MKQRSPALRILSITFLMSYFLIAILLTEAVLLPTAVLLLVLALWFVVYRLRFGSLGTRALLAKMYTDLEGALEGVKERIAQEEAQKRAAEERKEQALLERERRRYNRSSETVRDPAVDRYAGIIETRLREGEREGRDPERL